MRSVPEGHAGTSTDCEWRVKKKPLLLGPAELDAGIPGGPGKPEKKIYQFRFIPKSSRQIKTK
jgi:hypothetical protein